MKVELLEKDKEFLKEYEETETPIEKILSYITEFSFIILILILIFFIIWAILALLESEFCIDQKIINILADIFAICVFNQFFSFPLLALFIIPIKTRNFCKTHSISEQEFKSRYNTLKNLNTMFYIPLLQRFCRLNPDAKSTQIELIKKWYNIDNNINSDYVIDKEYSEEENDNAVNQLKTKDLGEKKTFINRLFQLVILEDGIHNDEWKLMMQLIAQLEFNKNYVNYFKERYESLRTEFDEYEKRSGSSGHKYLYSLKEYYSTLGLEENATDEEVRRAYHELALQHHPDLPKNASRIEECEKMMMKINEAYEKVRG